MDLTAGIELLCDLKRRVGNLSSHDIEITTNSGWKFKKLAPNLVSLFRTTWNEENVVVGDALEPPIELVGIRRVDAANLHPVGRRDSGRSVS